MVSVSLVALAAVLLASARLGADAACSTAPFGKCGSNADGVSCCPDGQYCQPWDAGFFQCIVPPEKCKQQLTNVDLYGNDIKTVYGIQPGNCCDECAKTPGCVAYTFVNSNPGQPACYLKSAVGERRTSVGAVSGIINNTPTPSPGPTVTPTPTPTPTPTVTPTPGPAPAQCSQQLANVDLYGNDIKTVTGIQNSECCAQCAQTAGCVAYTFTNNNGQTACYLKNGMGERRALPGAVSGVLNTPTPTPNPGCSTALYGSCGSSSGTTCCPSGSYCQPWNPTFYQCINVPPRCTQQLTDMDLYGNDIKTVYVSLPTLCCDECANTPGCMAYTYVNNNPGQPACYLKSAAGTPTRSVGAVSGRLN